MNDLLANRINSVSESQTILMTKMARALQEKGAKVINLSIGEPDFDTPDHIRKAAKKAIDEGYTKYPPVAGFPELRKAISEKFKKDNELDYLPEQVIVSTGAKHSIMNVIMSLVNPGDEVIIPAPYWVSYPEMVKLAGGIPRFMPSTFEDNYKPDFDHLKKLISPRTKLFLFSSPCNPSGTVFSRQDLEHIVNLIAPYDHIHVVSDEIYEHISYEEKHVSIGSFPQIKDRVITVNGVSKAFAMTGWRIGYMGAPLWITKACEKLQGQFTSGANSIAQKAAEAALTSSLKPTEKMRDSFEKRRDVVYKQMNEIDGVRCNFPSGAFYVFPDMSAFFGRRYKDTHVRNANDLCMYLLEEAHVSTVTGSAFGNPECIRISYAVSEEELKEAIARMKKALNQLKDVS